MKKGSFGYLQRKRTVSLIRSCLLVAAVFVIYYAALRHFGTNKNVFSILAAVMALPAAKSTVIAVMCLRAKGASAGVRDAVCAVEGLPSDVSGFDLCLTSYERAYSLSHAAVLRGVVTGLTEDPATDCRLCAQHIEKTLAANGIDGYAVRISRDPDAYVRDLQDLVAGVDREPGEGTRDGDAGMLDENEGALGEDRAVMRLLYAVSL